MTMTRRRLLDDTFKKSVTGNPAIATGSLARRYPGITMQGWTEQAKTTGAQLLDESTIEQGFINGNTGEEADSANMCRSGFIPIKPNTQYYFSSQYRNWVFFYDSSQIFLYSQSAVSILSPENAAYMKLRWYNADGNLSPQDVIAGKPMLNEGTTALPYEPYTGGQPSPSPDYPQEIVSAGKYNEDTQKWEYEITIANEQTDPDKNQTVTLTADRPLTKWDKLEKRNGQWGWMYKSNTAVFDGSEEWSLYPDANVGTIFYTAFPNASFGLQTSLCDKYRNINFFFFFTYNGVFGIYGDNVDVTNKYFRPPSAAVETVEQWKAWLSENPLTVLFETSTETFVPLAASEQEAMNALHTYRPTTVLSNQQDCDMTLTYKTRKGMN